MNPTAMAMKRMTRKDSRPGTKNVNTKTRVDTSPTIPGLFVRSEDATQLLIIPVLGYRIKTNCSRLAHQDDRINQSTEHLRRFQACVFALQRLGELLDFRAVEIRHARVQPEPLSREASRDARYGAQGKLRIELRGNLAAMLTAAQQTKRSPETGDLLMPVQLVARARNRRYLQLWSGAA